MVEATSVKFPAVPTRYCKTTAFTRPAVEVISAAVQVTKMLVRPVVFKLSAMAPKLLEPEFKTEIPEVPSFLIEPVVTVAELALNTKSAAAVPTVAEVGSALKLQPCMEAGYVVDVVSVKPVKLKLDERL